MNQVMKPYADNLSKGHGINLTMILEHIVKNKTPLFLTLYDKMSKNIILTRLFRVILVG